jgi:DNA-binding MarR family transcriptional regulator
MKRRPQGPKTAHTEKPGKQRTRSVKLAKLSRPNGLLEETLSVIKTHPGIRPSELNRLLNVGQSDGVRNTLIKRGLIRKEKDGSAMRYYLV